MLDVGLFIIAPNQKDISIITEEDELPKFKLKDVGLLKDQIFEHTNQYFQVGENWTNFHSLGYIEPPLVMYFGTIIPEEVPLKRGTWQLLSQYMDKMSPDTFARLSGFVLEKM